MAADLWRGRVCQRVLRATMAVVTPISERSNDLATPRLGRKSDIWVLPGGVACVDSDGRQLTTPFARLLRRAGLASAQKLHIHTTR